jgi:hypothetical protein
MRTSLSRKLCSLGVQDSGLIYLFQLESEERELFTELTVMPLMGALLTEHPEHKTKFSFHQPPPDKLPLIFSLNTVAESKEEKMAKKKKKTKKKYGAAAGKSVKKAMHRRKKGTLKKSKGGKGGKVKSRKQAIAIGLSEARKKGAKVPAKKKAKSKK